MNPSNLERKKPSNPSSSKHKVRKPHPLLSRQSSIPQVSAIKSLTKYIIAKPAITPPKQILKIKSQKKIEGRDNKGGGTHRHSSSKIKQKSKEPKKGKRKLIFKEAECLGKERKKTERHFKEKEAQTEETQRYGLDVTTRFMSKVIKPSDKISSFPFHHYSSTNNLHSPEESMYYSKQIKSTAQISYTDIYNSSQIDSYFYNPQQAAIDNHCAAFEACFNTKEDIVPVIDLSSQTKLDSILATLHLVRQKRKLNKQREQSVDARYCLFQQKVTPKMRAQVVDWLQSLSEEIYIRRETFHLSVEYFDQYLSIERVRMEKLQLVAIAALILAFNFEQKTPAGFVEVFLSTEPDFGYTKDEILGMEIQLAKNLKYRLSRITLVYWVNAFTDQWDQFISDGTKLFQNKPLLFRQTQRDLLVNLMHIIDCLLFSLDTYLFHKHQLTLAAIYLSLRSFYQSPLHVAPFKLFLQKYNKSINPIFIDKHSFNQLFSEFLKLFRMQLEDIVGGIKYVYKFLGIDWEREQKEQEGDPKAMDMQGYNKYCLYYVVNL